MSNKFYAEIRDHVSKGAKVTVVTALAGETGKIAEQMKRTLMLQPDEGLYHEPSFVENSGDSIFYEPIISGDRLIVLGGGHIAKVLCEFAAKTGFSVTVVDDREEFANQNRFPQADQILCDEFTNALARINVREEDYVVIVTRGHKWDGDCLKYVIEHSHPYYLGTIGSRRRVGAQFELFSRQGIDRQRLSEVHTPIGLPIGAVTPEEIAVSILAELIACRRQSAPKKAARVVTDLDASVIQYLANNEEKAVVATLLCTSGSTPRKAGAKMVVHQDGRIVGTVGGGRAEKEVIEEAGKMIGQGTFKICSFDLQGDVAENTRMACGGTMKILLEDLPL